MNRPSHSTSIPCPVVLAITHRNFIDGKPKLGGLDIILDELRAAGHAVLLVELTLAGRLGYPNSPGLDATPLCIVRHLSPDREISLVRHRFMPFPEVARWGIEVARLPAILRRSVPGPLPELALCADPLCCLGAEHLIRRRMIGRYHFHCVDYSDGRFGIRPLDAFYRFLYRTAVRRAASVDVVSRPMYRRMESFLGGDSSRLLWLPNTPDVAEYPVVPAAQRRARSLVCSMVGVESIYRVTDLVRVLAALCREFSDARLVLLGKEDIHPAYASEVRRLAAALGVADAVEYAGFRPRPEARRVVAECSAGIALYDGTVPHIRYIDSLKIREYAASGLPVVGDVVCDTAVEAQEAGAGWAVRTVEEAAARVAELWRDAALYERTSAAARRWAESRDKREGMRQLLALMRLGL